MFSIVPNCTGWYVEYKDQEKDLSHTEKFDFVILCTGLDSESQFSPSPNADNSMTSQRRMMKKTKENFSSNDTELKEGAEIDSS